MPTTLIAKDLIGQEMFKFEKVERKSLTFGLKLNLQKIKLMIINLVNKIENTPNIRDVENVKEITYLGTYIKREGNSSTKIGKRIVVRLPRQS